MIDASTAGAALKAGAAYLAGQRLERPGLDALLLLAAALDVPKSVLYTHPERPLSTEERERYQAFLRRRREGECAAYITGHKAFRFLDIEVSRDVLVPRADTETLVEAVLEEEARYGHTAPAPFTALDLCTGSGAVALALKHERPRLRVSASDISEAALTVARRNAARLSLDIAFIQSDLFKNIRGPFNLIAANPPYIPTEHIRQLAPEVRGEPERALDGGPDGLTLIRAIIPASKTYLRAGGRLFLEASPEQMPQIRALFEQAGFEDIRLYNDLSGVARVMSAAANSQPTPTSR